MESIRHQRVKLLIAGAIASGLVAIGAVAAVAVGQQQTGTVNGSPMTIGGTATTTTPPTGATDGERQPDHESASSQGLLRPNARGVAGPTRLLFRRMSAFRTRPLRRR